MCITKLRLICMQQANNSSYESKRGGLTFTQTSSPLAYYQISFILGSIIPLILATCNHPSEIKKTHKHQHPSLLLYQIYNIMVYFQVCVCEFEPLSAETLLVQLLGSSLGTLTSNPGPQSGPLPSHPPGNLSRPFHPQQTWTSVRAPPAPAFCPGTSVAWSSRLSRSPTPGTPTSLMMEEP